jgi:amidophosphoribosyltransferase
MAVSLPEGVGSAAAQCYDGLRQQQHRGQDGSGMVIRNDQRALVRKRLGLVAEVYPREWLRHRAGCAIGHNRYATQGAPSALNLQPHRAVTKDGRRIYCASNGDVTNFRALRTQLRRRGVRFTSQNDAELLAWLVADLSDEAGSFPDALRRLRSVVTGAYAAVFLVGERIFVARDPFGFRPLVCAPLPNGGIAVASETIAFDILGADPLTYQEVRAGGILELFRGRMTVHERGGDALAPCKFEHVYFSRPDSTVFGVPCSLVRRRIGWRLGKESGFRRRTNTVVLSVPDSANWIAQGVAEWLGVPFIIGGLIRSHTARRTFIEKEQRIRDEGVRYKLNPDRTWIAGATVLLVDDSIVRGTTIGKIVSMLLRAGAKEVHLLIGSPPIRHPCFMGVATPTREELVANQVTQRALRRVLRVASLTHISLEGLKASAGPLTREERERFALLLRSFLRAPRGSLRGSILTRLEKTDTSRFCYACFTGEYPIPIPPTGRSQ